MKSRVKKAAEFLKKELLSRRPGKENFVNNFQIFDFDTLSSFDNKKLFNYGNKEIAAFAEYYLANDEGCLFDEDLILFEWKKLKSKLPEEAKKSLVEYLSKGNDIPGLSFDRFLFSGGL